MLEDYSRGVHCLSITLQHLPITSSLVRPIKKHYSDHNSSASYTEDLYSSKMASNNNYSGTYKGQPSYIHKNCHFSFDYYHVDSKHLQHNLIALAAIHFAMTPAIIILNILTILTFIYKTKFRIASHILLCAVAITDLIAGLTAIPILGFMHLFRYLGKTPCALYLYGIIILFTVILLTFVTMTLIAFDKYFAIFHPYKYSAVIDKHRVIVKILAILWTLVALIGGFTVFSDKLKLVRNAVIVIAGPLLPFAIFVHIKIFIALRRHRKEIHMRRTSIHQASVINNIRIRRDGTQGLRATTSVITVSFVCYIPISVFGILLHTNFIKIHSDIENIVKRGSFSSSYPN